MKKRISILLAVLIIMSILPISVFAASGSKLVAITFDDGPSQYTPTLLDGLKKRDAKCTFFIVGQNAESYSSTVKRAWEEGHEIAGHTYSHQNLNSLSSSAISSTLSKTDAALNKALGFNLKYNLRPPYGNANSSVMSVVGRPCFYWSVDTRDWESRNADSVYNQIMNNTKDGSVVLLHDIYGTSVTGVLRAIDSLKAKGYEFVTVSELFYRRGITLQDGVMYYSAYPGNKGTADGIMDPVISVKDTEKGKEVTITGDSRGSVYYTTNGAVPNPSNSTKYTGPFYVSADTTVTAVSAINWNGLRSSTSSKHIEYTPVATPVIKHSGYNISVECATPGAAIYYTTDGKEPTEKSKAYLGAITLQKGTTYKVRAYAKGYDPSPVATLTYSDNGYFFEDISVKDWCYAAVDRAVSEGIFKGVTATRFEPDTRLNRAMLVTVLYRMAGSPDVSGKTEPFTDVDSNYWAYKEIIWGYNAGIIQGYADGKFMPAQDISRQALCAMISRYAKHIDSALSTDKNVLSGFSDAGSVANVFKSDVNTMCALGIVQGYKDGAIHPTDSATRAQTATMLLRFEDILKETAKAVEAPAANDAENDEAAAEALVKTEDAAKDITE